MAIVKPVILEGGQLKTAGVGDQVPQSYVQGLDTLLETKVDKVSGKTLSDTNFTQAEKTKLSGVAVGATANRADTLNADKVHTHTAAQVTGLDTALGTKVDKVAGKGLSDTNFTQVEKTKLAGIASEATKNRADSENADKLHTHAISDVTGLATRLSDIDTLINEAATSNAIIDDTAGVGDTEVTWSADKSSRDLADKVDKVFGYSLVADDEIAKLSDVEQIVQAAAQQAASAIIAGVDGQVAVAQSAADRAEVASDAAFVNADVYATVAEGRAAVAVGEQFQVLSTDGFEYIRYRKDSGSTQTEVGRYPSTKEVSGLSGREFSYIETYSGSIDMSSDVSLTTTESTELTLSGNGWALGHNPSKITIPTSVIKGESSFLSLVMSIDGDSEKVAPVFQQIGTNRLNIASNGYGLIHNDGIMTIFRGGQNEVFSAYKQKPMIISALYDDTGAYFFMNDSLVSFAAGLSAPTGTSSSFLGGITAEQRDLTQRLHEVRFINGDCNSETLKGQLTQLKSKYSISDSSSLFCGLGATVNAGAQYVALDENGNVLAKGGKQRKDSPASMTKVMTLLLSLKYLQQDDELVIAQEDIVQDSLLAAGDTITVKDAQLAAILASSNTSANALCRAVGNAIDGGGKSSGVAEMNLTALSFGCPDTNFVNGSGIYNSAHMSTARDQCVIALEASKDTRALRIMSTQSADIKINGETNQLTSSVTNIGSNGVVSGKTGFISSPSVGVNNVVNIVSKDGMYYAVCVMNATAGDGRFDMVDIVINGISKSMEFMQ